MLRMASWAAPVISIEGQAPTASKPSGALRCALPTPEALLAESSTHQIIKVGTLSNHCACGRRPMTPSVSQPNASGAKLLFVVDENSVPDPQSEPARRA